MSHPRAARAPLLAAAAALAATASLAQTHQPDPDMGARLVAARCTACHGESATPSLALRCMETHGPDYLDTFLKRHHAPDDAARADIIAYLTCPPAE